MDELPAALLTNSQREYVLGTGDDPSNEDMMKSRIRKRVFAGLDHDGEVLTKMDPDLRREIFRQWENKIYRSLPNGSKVRREDAVCFDDFEKTQFGFGLQGLLGFIFLGLEESGVGDFWDILESAIDQAVRERGQHVKSFEPNIEFGDLATVEDIYRMWQSGDLELEDLTFGEIEKFVETGLLDPEDITDENLRNWMGL